MDTIKVGDRVGFSKAFLRSISAYTGPVPFARGTVKSVNKYGTATIVWDRPDEVMDRVNVANLVTVRQIQLGE